MSCRRLRGSELPSAKRFANPETSRHSTADKIRCNKINYKKKKKGNKKKRQIGKGEKKRKLFVDFPLGFLVDQTEITRAVKGAAIDERRGEENLANR